MAHADMVKHTQRHDAPYVRHVGGMGMGRSQSTWMGIAVNGKGGKHAIRSQLAW